ncbi:MAG: diguanylate cyclase [Rhodocyclaceae bacterium]|nr:diguanylate cyclase [Rhodocyclaceae bacterium]
MLSVKRIFLSLKTRLIVFALLLVLVGLLIRFNVLSSFLQDELHQVVANQQTSLASYVAEDIDAKIKVRRDLVHRLAEQLPHALLRQPDALAAWLADRHTLLPLFSAGILVVLPSGVAFSDHPRLPGRRGTSYADRDWFLAVRNSGLAAMGAPTVGRATRRPGIVMAAPIKNAQGQLIAILAGVTDLDAPGFLDSLQKNSIGESGGFLLISPKDKLFVMATDPSMTLQPLPGSGINPLHDRAMAGYRGSGITTNAKGVEEISAIASIPSSDWFLVARIPTREAFNLIPRLQNFLLRNSLVVAAVVSLSVFLFLAWIFRPLASAARQVHAMATGAMPLRALPVAIQDEVGELTAGFNLLLGKLREREAVLARIAHHDPLTALPNRSAFLDRLSQSIALAQRQGKRLALLFLDLDGFKPVNDDHGHETGDQLLRLVAQRLQELVRKSDMVARFGGDEFVILLTDIGDPDAAGIIAQKCVAALSQPMQIGKLKFQVGASIGIALFPDHADNADSLLAHADAAMYDAKHAGRNGYRFAPPPQNN